jgi:hypothetical protein
VDPLIVHCNGFFRNSFFRFRKDGRHDQLVVTIEELMQHP